MAGLLADAALHHHYTVHETDSAALALEHAHGRDVAVIVLDLSQADGEDDTAAGFATAAAIHADARGQQLPILFLLHHAEQAMQQLQDYHDGAADYLVVPIVAHVLAAKVGMFVALCDKSRQLRRKGEQMLRQHRDLQARRLQELERINRELELEVAERKLAEERAHALSIHDPLTGLVNRRALIQQLEHAVASADRNNSQFALLFLDLDHFKSVNDNLGHEVGDALLRQVAARLCAAVRVSDVVARLGGDEFVVLVEGRAAAANAARVARKIAQAQTRPYHIGPHRVVTSSSIGIGLYPHDGDSAQTLMKNADLAMYHAKQQQRGGIQFFHADLNAREDERERWRMELRAALAAAQFELHYQPQAEIRSGAVCAIEAQLHWRHPRLGLIGAAQFLPAVPDRALLEQIDDWSIATACAQAAAWYADGLDADSLPAIGVNLAAAQLPAGLAARLASLLQRHHLAPGSIALELPERLLCGPLDHVAAPLHELGASGVAISLDHFGSAGAALTSCQALPLAGLKIDQRFTDAVADHGGGRDMAGAIVLMARALSLPAVALGVNTSAQLAALEHIGCARYQGDLLCPAMPAAQLPSTLHRIARSAVVPAAMAPSSAHDNGAVAG